MNRVEYAAHMLALYEADRGKHNPELSPTMLQVCIAHWRRELRLARNGQPPAHN